MDIPGTSNNFHYTRYGWNRPDKGYSLHAGKRLNNCRK